MPSHDQQLGDLLIKRKLITQIKLEQVQKLAVQKSVSLRDALREQKIIPSKELAQAWAEVLHISFVDLDAVPVDDQAMADISRKAAATYRFIAYGLEGSQLLVAVENAADFQTLEAVKFVARKRGLTPKVALATPEAIERHLGSSARLQAEIGGAIQEFGRELAAAKTGPAEKDMERYVEEAPVTKVVAVIIRHAIEGGASDIHIEPEERELRIRYRIDGKLHTSLFLPKKVHAAIISRIKILSNLKIDETRLPQDGRFSSSTENRLFDFRVATMPTTFGEKVALRILDKSTGAPSFEDLGLWGKQQELFLQHLDAPHGIIFISGPTGAGKSTTLFTSLAAVNKPAVNIVTLEDPVEYEIEGVNQTQVHPDIGLTFASGLRSMLRQDPDIIMVGEVRDKDTAALAVHAALTGHLVLSTIHTNDAVGTVPRLIDMGIDPFLLAASLRLLVAQRLVGRLCQECKRPIPLPDPLRETIARELADVPEGLKNDPNQLDPKHAFESPGCPACQEGQVQGRLAIFEVVPVSQKLREAINAASNYDSLVAVARKEGTLSMRQDGLLKALAGKVKLEDVIRVTSEEEASASPSISPSRNQSHE